MSGIQNRYLTLRPRFRNYRDINNSWHQKVNIIIVPKERREGQTLALSADISKEDGTSDIKAEIVLERAEESQRE